MEKTIRVPKFTVEVVLQNRAIELNCTLERSNGVGAESASLEKSSLIQLGQKGFTGHSPVYFIQEFPVSYLGFSRLVDGVALVLHE